MTRRITLSVNDSAIDLDYFVQGFIDHTFSAMVASLEGTPKQREEIKSADIFIDSDKVTLNVNESPVPVNDFVSRIIRSTVQGMVSPLKGVSRPNKISVGIHR